MSRKNRRKNFSIASAALVSGFAFTVPLVANAAPTPGTSGNDSSNTSASTTATSTAMQTTTSNSTASRSSNTVSAFAKPSTAIVHSATALSSEPANSTQVNSTPSASASKKKTVASPVPSKTIAKNDSKTLKNVAKTKANVNNFSVHVVDASGKHAVNDVKPGEKLGDVLKSKGIKVDDYVDASGKPLNPNIKIQNGKNLNIYKLVSTTSSKTVVLKKSVVKEFDPNLYNGLTKIAAIGHDGKAISTVVVDRAVGTKFSKSSEQLTVVAQPDSEIVLIGTKPLPVVKQTNYAQSESVRSQVVSRDYSTTNFAYNNISSANTASSPSITNNFSVDVPVGLVMNPAVSAQVYQTINNTPNLSAARKAFVYKALEQVGKPYVWGAVGPDSFDCSGLVYYALNQAGVKIPRLTAEDYGTSSQAISWSQLQVGDILWSPEHIGIYIGNNQVVNAANPRVGVVVESTNWFIANNFSAARILPLQ